MKDQPIAICPKDRCGMKKWGKGKVSRGISGGAGLIFKGTGFYITDYRSEKYKEAAKKDSAAASASSTPSASSGSESKAAPAKAESKPAKTGGDSKKAG